MKSKFFNECSEYIFEKIGSDKAQRAVKLAEERLEELIEENADEKKEVKALTNKEIYPAISLYEALLRVGVEKEKAVAAMDYAICKRAEVGAKMMQSLMKIPGLYKKYPAMFKKVAQKQFGESAGFKAKYYDTEKTRVKFDMTHCLYCDVLKKYGCFEIVKCFCHTDDVNNGALHEKLVWNRTKAMGEGADSCDFDLFVK